jgi:hypothetical protein
MGCLALLNRKWRLQCVYFFVSAWIRTVHRASVSRSHSTSALSQAAFVERWMTYPAGLLCPAVHSLAHADVTMMALLSIRDLGEPTCTSMGKGTLHPSGPLKAV